MSKEVIAKLLCREDKCEAIVFYRRIVHLGSLERFAQVVSMVLDLLTSCTSNGPMDLLVEVK